MTSYKTSHNHHKQQDKQPKHKIKPQSPHLLESIQQTQIAPNSFDHEAVLQLQGTLGNVAVQRMLASNQSRSPKTQPKPPIQPVSANSKSIQRMLTGNADALELIEKKKKSKFKSKWQSIISALRKYEQLERNTMDAKNRNKRGKTLDTIAKMTKQWLSENRDNVDASRLDKDNKQIPINSDRDDKKFSALIILRGRLAEERRMLDIGEASSDYTHQREHTYEQFNGGGQVADIGKITYGATQNQGEEQGYFQNESTFDSGLDNAGVKTGIPQHDPNFGARAVAMGKIDHLITEHLKRLAENQGIDIQPMLVNTQFANRTDEDNNTKQGIFLEKAKGKEMRGDYINTGNVSIPGSGLPVAQGADTLSLDDPLLMRSLNKLQILDALCGQVDRHVGNYFIETDDSGNVIGVQGIDNDMAFGKDITDPNDPKIKELIEDKAWRGLPTVIDSQMKAAVMAIDAENLRALLVGLLSEPEIDSTVSRLQATQQFFAKLDDKQLIKLDEWQSQKARLFAMQKADNSYIGDVKGESVQKLVGPQLLALQDEYDRYLIEQINSDLADNRKVKMFISNATGKILAAIVPNLMVDQGMSLDRAKQVGKEIGTEFLNKSDLEKMKTASNQELRNIPEQLVQVLYLEKVADLENQRERANTNFDEFEPAPNNQRERAVTLFEDF